ncbi:hypothetical protein U9M48_037267 [Paspalum notatum var. saurae]|uniref:F-box domain-containing protein n=1 Tax=Paspalum notatum var. saurae TaxID=547442 RepID=A0AAQ3UGQ5_PASNO
MQHCMNSAILSRNRAMDLIATKHKNIVDCSYNSKERTWLQTYKRRVRGPALPDELVYEILLRLPVQTLVRCKSVCKAWFAIISSQPFILMHLKRAASRHDMAPSFIITPHTLNSVIDDEIWPTTFSSNIRFYHWQDGQDTARLMHATDLHGEFESVFFMSHCNGLVLLPTDTKIYVFNPATGEFLKLPDGQKGAVDFQSAGLGLDLGTNTYKVVRTFYRSADFVKRVYSIGMQVFTIGALYSCWRMLEDPPLPVWQRQSMYFKGSLLFHINEDSPESSSGFLRLDLEDETFSFISHPLLTSHKRLDFVELDGELCLAQHLLSEIVIWQSPSDGNNQWRRLYVINLPEAWTFYLFNCCSDHMLLRSGTRLYCYNKAGQTAKEVVCVEQLREALCQASEDEEWKVYNNVLEKLCARLVKMKNGKKVAFNLTIRAYKYRIFVYVYFTLARYTRPLASEVKDPVPSTPCLASSPRPRPPWHHHPEQHQQRTFSRRPTTSARRPALLHWRLLCERHLAASVAPCACPGGSPPLLLSAVPPRVHGGLARRRGLLVPRSPWRRGAAPALGRRGRGVGRRD